MVFTRSFKLGIILIVLAEFVLISLGIWQVRRLEWKKELIASVEAVLSGPSQAFVQGAFSDLPQNETEFRYIDTRVLLDPERRYFLRPRTLNGEVGGHLIYATDDIILNFGWLTEDAYASLPDTLQKITVSGLLMKLPTQRPRFVPPNDGKSDRLYWPAAKALDSRPYMLRVNPLPQAMQGAEIVPLPLRPNLRNKHAQYAAFWFSMAGILLILAGAAFRKEYTS